ncbi:MAG: ABC transporter permease [Rubricoccaceae bacterium]
MTFGPFERTLALRYLRGADGNGDRNGFLRFVILAAIGGVAVGTGALLLAMMIVRGFSREIEAKIVGFGQEVQVASWLGDPLDGADSLRTALLDLDGVEAATPAVIDFSLLRGGGGLDAQVDGVLLWGTPEGGQPFIAERVGANQTFSFAADSAGRPGLVLGAELAKRLGLTVGDRVTSISTRGLGGDNAFSRPRVTAFHVSAIFETGLADFDERFAYVEIDDARELFDYGSDQATRIDLSLTDRERSREVAERITQEMPPPVFARPIEDVYRGLYAWVELQQSIVPLVISILVIVAAFNIVGALLMVVLEKAREIGTVLAMGASRSAVRRLFVLLGFLVGVVGAAAGATLALAFGWVQHRFEVIGLPSDAYYLDHAPVEILPVDVIWTVVAAVALCTLAAYLPARAAARIEPIRTIRFGG